MTKKPEATHNKFQAAEAAAGLSEPCLHSLDGIRAVRAEWLAALLPICLWSYFLFGGYALLTELLALLACIGTDCLLRLVRRKKLGNAGMDWDLTPVLTGLMIAFLLPSDCPLWLTALTGLLAAAIGQLFGGMSSCPLPIPALAVCVVRVCFSSMTDVALRIDREGGQTVAELLRAGEKPSSTLQDLLLGRTDGMIGEIASLLILLAAVYLIFRGHIGWQIPIAWLLGGALTAYLTAPETMSVYYYTGAQLLTGGFMLTGCLIAPDRISAPVTLRAGLITGFAGGALTILFRSWFGIDGALLAALICSLPARPLDRLMAPAPFGGRQK